MDLKLLIDKIRNDKGLDLSDYKDSTLERRINRRIQFDGADSLEEYIQMLDKDQHLYPKLIDDLFIKATEFFRDDDIWKLIKEEILTEIVRNKEKRQEVKKQIKPVVRIWSCGCAEGQEPYSLAMCLEEVLKQRGADLDVKIFATDVDEKVISKARKGEYRAGDVSKLPNSLLIVCRNVLIYFQRELQDKVIMRFHRALRKGGILWLGTAESLSNGTKQMFEPVYEKQKLFKKR